MALLGQRNMLRQDLYKDNTTLERYVGYNNETPGPKLHKSTDEDGDVADNAVADNGYDDYNVQFLATNDIEDNDEAFADDD
ncbi:MAG: hypothetical protein Q9208_000524 [Pyrenodesmia sp. 3 TL-2023]